MKRIKLAYDSLPGVVSSGALAEHLKLYEGYVANAEHDQHDLAGAILHELYFTGLTPKPSTVVMPVLKGVVQAHWGSLDSFYRDLRAVALKARGWAILGARDAELRLFSQDSHDDAVPGWEPLLALDVFEHSFWMDFGSRKVDYVDVITKCFDWVELERRWARLRQLGREI